MFNLRAMRFLIRPLLLALITVTVLLPGAASLLNAMPAPTKIAFGGPVGLAYSPSRLVVHVGDMVQWQGSLNIHPLISDEKLFAEQSSGTAFTFTFTQAGTFHYHCGRHSVMQGTVVVQAVE